MKRPAKRRINIWLEEEQIKELRRLASANRKKFSEVVRDAIDLYIRLSAKGVLSAARMLVEGPQAAPVVINQIGEINVGQLVEKLTAIEEMIKANTVNIVKIRLTERERRELKSITDDVARWAKLIAGMTPDYAANQAALSIEALERWRKRILDAVKTVEKRGLTLEDLASSQSQDAPLAKQALEVLKLVELALETAKADRGERIPRASTPVVEGLEGTVQSSRETQ